MDYWDKCLKLLEFRNVADHTIESYATYIGALLIYLEDHGIDPSEVEKDDIMDFLIELQLCRGLNNRTVNAAISQIKFFIENVLQKDWAQYRIPWKKFDTYLPYVPKREIVEAFINSITENLKFKTIIVVLYATGLRVSEVCNLRYENISRDNMEIYIPKSKNHHDRRVPISKITIDILTDYWYQYKKPREYLFTQARNPEKPLYTDYVNNHIVSQEKRLGWEHKLTPHSFRHAYATHFYEDTQNLEWTQHRLGHYSITSTKIYTRTAQLATGDYCTPIDKLVIR